MSTSKKMEDDLEKNIKKNGRRPKINIKKMEDDLKKNEWKMNPNK